MSTANILNVQRFCTKDGPGIRTTVFFKGCPLSCLWCHNPESQARKKELTYQSDRCVHCLRCTAACPQGCHIQADGRHRLDRTACIACGACLSPLCEALEITGEERTVDSLLEEIRKDALFYENSGGGLTLSGGEPLLQADACAELLRRAKECGIHTCIETCGYASAAALEKTIPWTDLYLFDWKESDPTRHQEYTGVDNRRILENLTRLDQAGKSILLRCPIIPSVNDRPDHLAGIAALANRLSSIREIVLEPYHTLGVGKYGRLGRGYRLPELPAMERDDAEKLAAELRRLTQTPVTVA